MIMQRIAIVALGLLALDLIVFELIIPSLWKHITRPRFRVLKYRDHYQVMFKYWPWSPWWSDIAALEGWSPDSKTEFSTEDEAFVAVVKSLKKIKRQLKKPTEVKR